MIDSELNELRRRKIKRILLWTCGLAGTAAIVTTLIILGLQSDIGGGA